MPIDLQQAAQDYQDGLAGAGPAYERGIDNVKENPMEKAIRAIPKQVRGVQEAASSGRTARGLRKRSFDQWKQLAKSKGAANLTAHADLARAGWLAAMEGGLAAAMDNAQRVIDAMPNDTEAQRTQRSIKWQELMRAYKRNRAGAGR